MKRARATQSGFTIMEIVIVVIVVSILTAIVTLGYAGLQARARNSSRLAVGEQWYKAFMLYRAQNQGQLPPSLQSAANGTRFCLGTGFPIGGGGVARCQNVTGTDVNSPLESANATLMSELKTAGALPSAAPIYVPGIVTGPYIVKNSATSVQLTVSVEGTYTVGANCTGNFIVASVISTANATCYRDIL